MWERNSECDSKRNIVRRNGFSSGAKLPAAFFFVSQENKIGKEKKEKQYTKNGPIG